MDMQRLADILVSSWVVATATENKRAKPLPTSEGILDRALKTVIENNDFSEDFRELRFIQSSVGVRCPELRRILSWAQAASQTSHPNPSYATTEVKISKEVAEEVLSELEIDIDEATTWGSKLSQAIAAQQTQKLESA